MKDKVVHLMPSDDAPLMRMLIEGHIEPVVSEDLQKNQWWTEKLEPIEDYTDEDFQLDIAAAVRWFQNGM